MTQVTVDGVVQGNSHATDEAPNYVASTTLADPKWGEATVLGQGTRLFPDAGPDIALGMVESRADSKGATIQVYRPTGRPQYAPNTFA